jgi:hypothetical protein
MVGRAVAVLLALLVAVGPLTGDPARPGPAVPSEPIPVTPAPEEPADEAVAGLAGTPAAPNRRPAISAPSPLRPPVVRPRSSGRPAAGPPDPVVIRLQRLLC